MRYTKTYSVPDHSGRIGVLVVNSEVSGTKVLDIEARILVNHPIEFTNEVLLIVECDEFGEVLEEALIPAYEPKVELPSMKIVWERI